MKTKNSPKMYGANTAERFLADKIDAIVADKSAFAATGIKLGSTTLSETQLIALLALLSNAE